MANHCWNWVHFTGKKENLKKLLDGLEKAKSLNEEDGGLIWYETFYTALGMDVPSEPKDTYDEFGSKWYDPRDIDFDGEGITITGSSAWSPVSEFFLKLSSIYQVKFQSEYEEEGMNFGGFYAGENGVVTDDRQYSHAQYDWLQRDFESIDINWHNLEDEAEAIEHYSSIQELCTTQEWEVILEIITDYFKHKQND